MAATGDPEQAVAAVADVRARIAMRLRRTERQVRDARAVVENGHDFAVVLAGVFAAREALQALARNVGVAQRMTDGTSRRPKGHSATQSQSDCLRRDDAGHIHDCRAPDRGSPSISGRSATPAL